MRGDSNIQSDFLKLSSIHLISSDLLWQSDSALKPLYLKIASFWHLASFVPQTQRCRDWLSPDVTKKNPPLEQ